MNEDAEYYSPWLPIVRASAETLAEIMRSSSNVARTTRARADALACYNLERRVDAHRREFFTNLYAALFDGPGGFHALMASNVSEDDEDDEDTNAAAAEEEEEEEEEEASCNSRPLTYAQRVARARHKRMSAFEEMTDRGGRDPWTRGAALGVRHTIAHACAIKKYMSNELGLVSPSYSGLYTRQSIETADFSTLVDPAALVLDALDTVVSSSVGKTRARYGNVMFVNQLVAFFLLEWSRVWQHLFREHPDEPWATFRITTLPGLHPSAASHLAIRLYDAHHTEGPLLVFFPSVHQTRYGTELSTLSMRLVRDICGIERIVREDGMCTGHHGHDADQPRVLSVPRQPCDIVAEVVQEATAVTFAPQTCALFLRAWDGTEERERWRRVHHSDEKSPLSPRAFIPSLRKLAALAIVSHWHLYDESVYAHVYEKLSIPDPADPPRSPPAKKRPHEEDESDTEELPAKRPRVL